jgi:hypothetical protein
MATTLTVNRSSRVVLTGGANAANVSCSDDQLMGMSESKDGSSGEPC